MPLPATFIYPDAPALVIERAAVRLLQAAFDALPARVGAPMTVRQGEYPAGKTILFPLCKVYVVHEMVDRWQDMRGNVSDSSRLDTYGFDLEYRPGSEERPRLTVEDLRPQAIRDAWTVVNTLTGKENLYMTDPVTHMNTCAEIGQMSDVKYSGGPFAGDAQNLVYLVSGRFTLRKRMVSALASVNQPQIA